MGSLSHPPLESVQRKENFVQESRTRGRLSPVGVTLLSRLTLLVRHKVRSGPVPLRQLPPRTGRISDRSQTYPFRRTESQLSAKFIDSSKSESKRSRRHVKCPRDRVVVCTLRTRVVCRFSVRVRLDVELLGRSVWVGDVGDWCWFGIRCTHSHVTVTKFVVQNPTKQCVVID